MTEREPKQPSHPDRTLLGVAPPKLESTPDSGLLRSPVFVRSGTTEGDSLKPQPLPRMALPSRPPGPTSEAPEGLSVEATPTRLFLSKNPIVWMVGVPALAALAVIGILLATAPSPKPAPIETKTLAAPPTPVTATPTPAAALATPNVDLATLEARPLSTLSAPELLLIANARGARRLEQAKALRLKLEATPGIAADKSVRAELLELSREPATAPDALAAMVKLEALGADLLYEVWTGTSAQTDATQLAQALLYTSAVRPHASAALAAVLELRAADDCEKTKTALPNVLKDADRRALPPLMKLGNKRGCGAKKNEDCFACLREDPKAVGAVLNAVKGRRAPSF